MNKREIEERLLRPLNGRVALFLLMVEMLCSVAFTINGIVHFYHGKFLHGITWVTIGAILFSAFFVLILGLKTVNPNEALVLVLYGDYYGTIRQSGFYYVHPFAMSIRPNHVATYGEHRESWLLGGHPKTISMKMEARNSRMQKVNDKDGNLITIGANVIWRVVDPTKAAFQVYDYREYLLAQMDFAIRSTVSNFSKEQLYSNEEQPVADGQTIAEIMQQQLQNRVDVVGLLIEEVIPVLNY